MIRNLMREPTPPSLHIAVAAGLLLMVAACCYLLLRLGSYFRRAIVPQDRPLPPICICCGRPATLTVRHTFISSESRMNVPVAHSMVGFSWKLFWETFSFTFLHFYTRSRTEFDLPFCRRHRFHLASRSQWIILLLCLAWPLAIYATSRAANAYDPYLDEISVVGMFIIAVAGWPLLLLTLAASGVRLGDSGIQGVALLGVHPRFTKALSKIRAPSTANALADMAPSLESPESKLERFTQE